MSEILISDYQNEIVFHFGSSKSGTINAYTLASSLVHIADAIKEANSVINPGYEIEVIVTAFGPGSFRVKINTVYKSLQNILSTQDLKSIVLGVVASVIFQYTFAPDAVKIQILSNEVIIDDGENKIVVPRQVYEATKQVEKSPKFASSVSKIFSEVSKDPEVTSFGVTSNLADEDPDIEIPKDKFAIIANRLEESEGKRIVREVTELRIKKAILARSKRKWEFVWRGVTINAPILDDQFYNEFSAHRIKIAPGDVLEAELVIYQHQDADTGIYVNKKYEVVRVQRHIPRPVQSQIVGTN